ncbi:hypothetical protein KOW79_005207 [Hemibagrus wyckioides]|uniref:non-specific serine/threonine protein kinase n=1 Tax=Hemibagrus wyckioides TaxID=337641 RepID=A0A9D3SP23_9TELE|nr:hypothetical protein KOW79_005206 [Hemibagrus wyckioides]KAG7331238.1 hypothetical protein KOW79_005207 [Hemibagrus wyckioides]
MMDLVWDMDYHRSQDTAEMPVFTELQAEMWDLDSEADDTPMPEKFTTYQDIQSEDWDVDDEPGETCKLHLEVALMQMLSKPPHCQYVLQLVDWFEMDNSLLLVLERPIPCMDVYELLLSEGGTLSEVLAKMIMLQVIHLSLWSLFG